MKMNNHILALSALAMAMAVVGCTKESVQAPELAPKGAPELVISRASDASFAFEDGAQITIVNNLSDDFTNTAGESTATYSYAGGTWSTNDKLSTAKGAESLFVTAFVDTDATEVNAFEMPATEGVVDQSVALTPFDYLYTQGAVPFANDQISLHLSRMMAKVNIVVEGAVTGTDEDVVKVLNIASGASRTAGGEWSATNTKATVKPTVVRVGKKVTISLLMPAQMWSQEISFVKGTSINFTTSGAGYAVESGKEYTFTINAGYSDQIVMEGEPTVRPFADKLIATAPEAIDTRDWDGSTVTEYAGTGTADDPYLINTGANLAYLAQQTNVKAVNSKKYFKLMGDISLNNFPWTPIGKGTKASEVFQGYFDGNGYTISDIKINQLCGDVSCGLFSWLKSAAKMNGYIKNLTLKNIAIEADASSAASAPNVGFIAGVMQCGAGGSFTIENCHVVNGKMNIGVADGSKAFSTGGIVGEASGENVAIAGCSVKDSEMSSFGFMGGIVGTMEKGIVQGCLADNVTINAKLKSVGGICAVLSSQARMSTDPDSAIIGCKSTGGAMNVAGIICSAGGIVSNCYGRVIGCFSDMPVVEHKANWGTGSIVATMYAGGSKSDVGKDAAKVYSSYTTYQPIDAKTGNAIGNNFGTTPTDKACRNVDDDGKNMIAASLASAVEDMNIALKAIETDPAKYFLSPEVTPAYSASYLYNANGDIVKVQ